MELNQLLRKVISGSWTLLEVIVIAGICVLAVILLFWLLLRAIFADDSAFRPVPGQTHEAQLSVETFSTSTEDVLALKTPLDGDSLFTAVAHQLQFPVPQLRYGASILRRGAIIQMISSLERYRDLLLESAAVHEDRYSQLIPEDSLILRHLHDLCQPGFPAAIASAQALADSLRVNITILPESGLKYELHGKGSDGRNLYLGLRRVVLDDDNVTTHFDSVLRTKPN